MASAGRILIMPKGEWNVEAGYENLDLVSYNGSSWLAKKPSVGIEPSDANSEYWHHMSDFSFLEKRKQERTVQNVTVPSGGSYELIFAERECCLLCAYISEPMYYSGIFACCGINAWSYSIAKLSESLYGGSFTAVIADSDGSDVNKITFKNETDIDTTLTLVKLPLDNI